MIRTLLPAVLLFILASCSKSKELTAPEVTTATSVGQYAAQGKKPEACNFGMTSFNKSRRAESSETYVGSKKPRRTESLTVTDAVIYLDFDGQEVKNTVWNFKGDLQCAPANLYQTEVDKIIQRVSEDYAPFNVVVTTNEAEYLAANQFRRMRVIITESWEWYGTVGGIAYYDSFTWGDNTPCFVFSTLLNYNEKFIAEAISHEVGHTFGLRHQAVFANGCNFVSEYNEGLGSGETSWAPIMGNSYYRNVTTWNKGAAATGCGVIQDDVAILAGILGKKADLNTEFAKSVTINTSAEGVITAENDIDYYYLDVANTSVVEVHPVCLDNGVGANLHLKINVYDKSGKLLQSASDPNTLSAKTTLTRGKYYIGIETTSNNNNQSKYGMLGRYLIKAI